LWTCRLSHIIIGIPEEIKTNGIKIYSRAVIDSGSNFIYAPEDAKELFIGYFANTTCELRAEWQILGYGFYCNSTFNFNSLPPLSFVLNGMAYTLSLDLCLFE